MLRLVSASALFVMVAVCPTLAQPNTAQPNTAQPNTAQKNTAQQNAAQLTTAKELFKQSYVVGYQHQTAYLFTLHKGGSAFACRFSDPKPSPEGQYTAEILARAIGSATCAEMK